MEFNELFDYERIEVKARQLEERILKVPGMSKSYLPSPNFRPILYLTILKMLCSCDFIEGMRLIDRLFLLFIINYDSSSYSF